MQRMRRRQHDCADGVIGEHLRQLADQSEPVPAREIPDSVRIPADRASKAQLGAFALDRLDQGLAPSAQTDDRRVNHRPAGWASNG